MIYNNLLYFLVVILIFSTSSVPDAPQLPLHFSLPVFLIKAIIYYRWALHEHRGYRIDTDSHYFSSEQKFSILAIFFFATDVYLLDCKYYFNLFPFTEYFPVLINLAGLCLFFFYLCIMWAASRTNYHLIFDLPAHRQYSLRAFLLFNIKTNLPVVLPWLFLTLILDIFQLIPLPLLNRLPASQWAEPAIFLIFFLFLATTFPGLVKWLWNCTPLPAGPERDHIEEFSKKQGFTSEILLWPLFEGRVITAGVMGISKKFRYLLITPALLTTLDIAELEAVLAHEIGHVKKRHLQLYLVLFLGFGLLLSLIANPVLYLLLNTKFFYKLISLTNGEPSAALAFWSTVPLFFIMIVYFRYVFGFFMRNFERQADLYVFKAIGNSDSLIRSFEKIGRLTGKRDAPSWHHFGIGQRIDFLRKCSQNKSLIRRHHVKVYVSLLLYVLTLAGGAGLIRTMPLDPFDSRTEANFAEAIIKQRIMQEPDNALWLRLLGDLNQERKMDVEALAAYSKGLAIEPSNPEIMNNYAWVLLVSENKMLRDPEKALSLALAASARRSTGYILDTLAVAYWANGSIKEAVNTAKKAIEKNPENRKYYEEQIEKFLNEQYK